MKFSRLLLAAVAVFALSGCVFSLEYITPNGTSIGGSSDGRTVTLGASREQTRGSRGEIKQPGFGASTTFTLPRSKGLKK